MRKDKYKAEKLRRSGESYKNIHKQLGVPVSTLSNWFSKQDWSSEVAKKLANEAMNKSKIRMKKLNKARKMDLKSIYEQARKEAIDDCLILQHHPLFVAGVMLYWGEGDKVSKNAFRIANSDPEMIRIFVEFITKICRIPIKDIKASLIIYPDIDEKKCKRLWKNKGGLANVHFTKSSVILGRHKSIRNKNGVCTITVSRTYLKQKMLVWMDLLPKLMQDKNYYKSRV